MTPSQPGSRLEVDARREQLLRVGRDLFSRRTYDGVWIDEIASAAGVSRGLLYHYFPTKRDFYVAVIRAEVAEMWAVTEPDRSLPPLERLRASMDAYVRYAEENAQGFIALHRGGVGSDEEIRALVEECLAAQFDRTLAELSHGDDPPEVLRLAVRGWVGFVVAATLDWLDTRALERGELRDLLVFSLTAALGAARAAHPGLELELPDAAAPGA